MLPELTDCLLNVCVARDGQMREWALVSVTTLVTTFVTTFVTTPVTTSEHDVTGRMEIMAQGFRSW